MKKTELTKENPEKTKEQIDFGGDINITQNLDLTEIKDDTLESLIEEFIGPLADDYSLKILAATREEGKTVRELSRELDIPIATCYRRVEELVEASLLRVKEKKLTQDGKRATVVKANVSNVELSFSFDDQSISLEIKSGKG